MKLNKKFWNRALIVIVIVFLIHITIQSQNKKEWHGPDQGDCNTANGATDGICYNGFSEEINFLYLRQPYRDTNHPAGDTCIGNQADRDLCTAKGCKIGRTAKTGFDVYGCFGCLPDGGVRTKNTAECCSGNSLYSEYKEGYDYLCSTPDPDDPTPTPTCNAAEKPIAKIIQSMGLFKDDCKTAYTVGIFGGAFLVLIVLAAMI